MFVLIESSAHPTIHSKDSDTPHHTTINTPHTG